MSIKINLTDQNLNLWISTNDFKSSLHIPNSPTNKIIEEDFKENNPLHIIYPKMRDVHKALKECGYINQNQVNPGILPGYNTPTDKQAQKVNHQPSPSFKKHIENEFNLNLFISVESIYVNENNKAEPRLVISTFSESNHDIKFQSMADYDFPKDLPASPICGLNPKLESSAANFENEQEENQKNEDIAHEKKLKKSDLKRTQSLKEEGSIIEVTKAN